MNRAKNVYILLIINVLFILYTKAFAIETVRLEISKPDGSMEQEVKKLKRLKKNVYRLEMPISEIYGLKDIKIIAGEAKKGDKGYFVLADGRLGEFTADDGKLRERRNPMSLIGFVKGEDGFVGIVKGLKNEFSSFVEVNEGNYSVGLIFHIEGIEFDPYEDLVIDFHNLKGSDANYSEMGKIYRKYQLDRGEVKPLRERVKNNPQLAYSVDTMFVRVKHGTKKPSKIEDQTLENEPPIVVAHTFDNFMKIMKDLKALGVEKVEMCSVGWNAGGFDGRFPDLFPVPQEFGGEAKLKEAVKLAKDLGYQIVCHVCNTDFYKIASRFKDDLISKRFDGSLRPYGHMSGGRAYNPCFQCVADRIVNEDYKKLSEIGFKGTHHIDVTSAIVPYTCHDPNHPCNRKQTADYQNKIGEKARKIFGGFGSEGPCDHVAKTLDFALYVWAYPKWIGREHPLVSRLVPIWQIAYHGIILSNPYYSTIDYNIDAPRKWLPYAYIQDPKVRRLKLYEFGGRPVYYFNNYKNLKPIKEAYDEYQKSKHLQYEFMDSHRQIQDGIFETEYSDGTKVVTNYTDKEFFYNAQSVPAMDYKIFAPNVKE